MSNKFKSIENCGNYENLEKIMEARESFVEFCSHLYIGNPYIGDIKFELSKYQADLYEIIDASKDCFIVKPRQGGYSTLMMAYALYESQWNNKNVLYICTSSEVSRNKYEIMLKMEKSHTGKYNIRPSITRSAVFFGDNVAGRDTYDIVILDESFSFANEVTNSNNFKCVMKYAGKVISMSSIVLKEGNKWFSNIFDGLYNHSDNDFHGRNWQLLMGYKDKELIAKLANIRDVVAKRVEWRQTIKEAGNCINYVEKCACGTADYEQHEKLAIYYNYKIKDFNTCTEIGTNCNLLKHERLK